MSGTGFYKAYYEDPGIFAWRKVSAVDKASNVSDLWHQCMGGGQIEVADIGCGDGALIRELDRRDFGVSYTGFEISESGLEIARMESYGKPSRFVLFDGDHLPVRNLSFDLAILSHVLEHVDCPRLLLREAARIASHVFVEVPLEFNLRTQCDFQPTAVGHINLFNPLLIRHLAQSAGLRVMQEKVRCPGLHTFTYQRNRWKGTLHWMIKATILRLFPAVASRFFTYHGALLLIGANERKDDK